MLTSDRFKDDYLIVMMLYLQIETRVLIRCSP